MSQSPKLNEGRIAFAERRWVDALSLLAEADAAAPLDVSDLQRLARTAAMLGRDDTMFRILERGYGACIEREDHRGAFQAAFWHGFRLLVLGEMAQGTAWMARAAQALERVAEQAAEPGYLILPELNRLLARGDFAAAAERASIAAAIGDRFRDNDLVALARHMEGRARLAQGDVEGGLGRLDEAMLTATGPDASDLVRGIVYCGVLACCQQVLAVERAREWTSVLAKWCDAQPQLSAFSGACRAHRAEILRINGAWSEALEQVRQGDAPETGGAAESPDAAYQEAEIHRLRGDFALAERCYRHAGELGGEVHPGFALLRLAQGGADAAAAAMRRVLATSEEPLQRCRFLPATVEIMIAAGAMSEAEAAAGEIAGIAARFEIVALQAMADHANGSLALAEGEPARALTLLKTAFGIWQKLEAPYLAARIRVELAVALERLGDTDGAQLERAAARGLFERLQARPDLERLNAGMRQDRSVLSRRELEVLRLAACGRTNKQIARELGLSDRTVDRHVSNILTKLAVPSRAAATAYAYQHRLIEA